MSSRPTLRAMLWRWRKLLTATLVALCIALAVASIGSSGRVTPVEMMVASRDLSAGHALSESDVRWVEAPMGTIPDELLLDQAEGTHLSIGIPAGTPLTKSMLVGPTLADSAPEGTLVIPIFISTPPELTPVGSTVDLWAADEGGTAYQAASSVTILAFSDLGTSNTFGQDTSELTYAYVAVSAEEATFVLGISTQTPLLAVLHR